MIINNVSFEITSGEIVSLVGHNGAGKTTLLKMISGILKADSGQLTIYGNKIHKKTLSKISMTLEGNKNFYGELTAHENISYFFRLKGYRFDKKTKSQLEYYLEIFRLKEYINVPVFKLSRGTQQKISIILNFVLPSEIILLDEPTLGLDVFSIEEFEKLVQIAKNEGKIVIITSHQLDLLERLSNRLIILDKGIVSYDNSLQYFIEQYSYSKYTINYLNSIPMLDLNKLDINKVSYSMSSEKSLIINSSKINESLHLLSINEIENITKSLSTLEDAYKNFNYDKVV